MKIKRPLKLTVDTYETKDGTVEITYNEFFEEYRVYFPNLGFSDNFYTIKEIKEFLKK